MSTEKPDEPEADILPPSPDVPRGKAEADDDEGMSGYDAGYSGGSGGADGTGYSSYEAGGDAQDDIGNPWLRLAYMVGFGFLGWLVFSLVVVLAVLQFIVAVVNKELNDDLKQFSGRTVIYLAELLGFITFQSDDKPFPFGPFPSGDSDPA